MSTIKFSICAIAIPACAASISVISSALIVFVIYRSQIKLSSVYHRIIFVMSSADIIGSTAILLTTIPMPRDQIYPYRGASYGTVTTCEIQGFLVLYNNGVALTYNCGLSLFYLCLVYFQMKDENIRKYVEPTIHIFCWIVPLIISVSTSYYLERGRNLPVSDLLFQVVTKKW